MLVVFKALKCSWRHGTHNTFQSSFLLICMEKSLSDASYTCIRMKARNQLVMERLFHCLEVILSLADLLGSPVTGNQAVLSPLQVWCQSAVASQVWVGDERCCQAPLNTTRCCEMLLVQPERSSYSSRYPWTGRNCFDQQITLHKVQVKEKKWY